MNMKEKRPTTNHQQSTHQLAGQPTGPPTPAAPPRTPSATPPSRGGGVECVIPLHEITSG